MKNNEARADRTLWLDFSIHHSAFILCSGIRGEIIIILRFERRVCRWESCRMHQNLLAR
jgi:hypothetical protein